MGLSKEETKKVAQKFADALSKADNVKVSVNPSFEEDSFDLDYGGIPYAGGSFTILANGDVRNDALPNMPIYGKTTDSIETIIKKVKNKNKYTKESNSPNSFTIKDTMLRYNEGGDTNSTWVVELFNDFNERTSMVRVDADNEKEAIEKAFNKLSENGLDKDEYGVKYVSKARFDEGGETDENEEEEEEDENAKRLEELVEEYDIPYEVIVEYASDRGMEISEIDDLPYNGTYNSEEDYAKSMVDEGVVGDLSYYLEMYPTDMRILAQELADSRVDDMDDDDILSETDMEDEANEEASLGDEISDLENDIDDLKSKLDDYMDEEDEDMTEGEREMREEKSKELQDEIDEKERELENLQDKYASLDSFNQVVEKAREQLREESYDMIYDALEKDAVGYFVDELGYDIKDLVDNNSFTIDYEKLARELGYDVLYINHRGEVYVFSNYEKGGMTYAKGGVITEEIKDGKKILTRETITTDKKGREVKLWVRVGKKSPNRGWFEKQITVDDSDDNYYVEGGLWIENGEIVEYDGVYYLPKEIRPLLSKMGWNSKDVYDVNEFADGGETEGNLEMIKNQAIEVKHHSEELMNALQNTNDVEAWVVAKMERATTDLSDITHYLDGQSKHMADGGMMAKGGFASKGGYSEKVSELKGGVDYYSVDIDLENGDNVRDLGYKSLEKAKKDYEKYSKSMVYEGEAIEDIQLIRVFKNGDYENVSGMMAKGGSINSKIIGIAKSHPYSLKTETSSYPVKDRVPKKFLKELDIELEKESDYILVLEIQFDTQKVILQEYYEDGENYDDVFSYKIQDLPTDFKEWLVSGLLKETKRIKEQIRLGKMNIVIKELEEKSGMTKRQCEEFLKKYKNIQETKFADGGYMAKGGETTNPSKKQMLDYLNMYFDYYSELRTIAIEEDNILTKKMLPTLDDEQIETAYEDAKYEIKADTEYAKGGIFEKLKRYGKKGVQKTKEGYGKAKEYTKKQIHDQKKKVAIEVIDDTKDKVGKDNKSKMILKASEELVDTKYKKGGMTFDDKVSSISKALLERKKVPKSVQKDYGKTFTKEEAIDSAKRIVGSMTKMERAKKVASSMSKKKN